MPSRTHVHRAEVALLLITLIWGSTFALTKLVLDYLPPLLFLAVRFSLAFLIMAVLFFRHLWRSLATTWRAGVLVGLALAAAYITQTVGMQTTNASKTAFITGLSVILVPIFNSLTLKRLPPAPVQVGAVCATAGLAFLSGIMDSGLFITKGDLWVIFCAVAFAVHILVTGRYAAKTHVPTLTAVQFAVVASACWIAGLGTEQWPGTPPWSIWIIIIFLVVIATCGAFFLQTWAQKRLHANRAAIILSMEPVFATFFWLRLTGRKVDLGWLSGLRTHHRRYPDCRNGSDPLAPS